MKEGIISLGEAVVDFIPTDETNSMYYKRPGGAPANVAVGVARLGSESVFLGKVGDDVLGDFLIDTMKSYGVNAFHVSKTEEVRTGTVFVTLSENGKRSFDFYIDPSADRFLEEKNIQASLFKDRKILHIGSISLIAEPSKSATEKAVKLAKENGMWVSFDPNLRLSLWKTPALARETILSMLPHADIVKLSEEELEFITGLKKVEEGIKILQQYNIPLLFITLGDDGSYVVTEEGGEYIPAKGVSAVDSTGAGDAYVSAILHQLNQYNGTLETLTLDEAADMAVFGSVSGALTVSSKGAMTSLPTLEQIKEELAQLK
ncbi:aminoimidazole riboside kinase [Fictibacillus phosphorivorans]|uniref:aminoimidazole riboside kinase n=1 Tax=Fictibacillus phosphorivorans TaxID=1221500 RepID=UPI00203CD696|nr:aminoimidazole riboside kinase [Fictibacillus phosphorivorans]MCM3720074.1 aminoimidazole riboside kinase [Fictibacillus phosphorivorans]MCM3777764.1 aminoimidazole riboside kinase [Fictibacillus phosphorivorans]